MLYQMDLSRRTTMQSLLKGVLLVYRLKEDQFYEKFFSKLLNDSPLLKYLFIIWLDYLPKSKFASVHESIVSNPYLPSSSDSSSLILVSILFMAFLPPFKALLSASSKRV